jgi:hypothetical protein
VSGIPEQALAAVLQRLAAAADAEGQMPPLAANAATVYHQLALVLEQISAG